jgi:protoheme IX farnesyltransferase
MSVQAETVAAPRAGARVRDYVELTKPRITTLVLITTWVGAYVAAPGLADSWLLVQTLIGTGLACSGCSALNQVWEAHHDRNMRRTADRPVPSGRLRASEAQLFGVTITLLGLLHLAVFVNLLAALLTAATVASYLFVYTPLKRRTWMATMVGAIPGALPPMIGWAAARGSLDAGAWILFAIQFIWQLPHFYAIGWMYRDDYARAGFPLLSTIDPSGRLTGNQIAAWTCALLPASLILSILGVSGPLFAVAAVLLGAGFLFAAARVAVQPTEVRARHAFLASIIYLPLLLGALVLDIRLGL